VGVVIDPVLDFDPKSARTWTESADRVARRIDALGLRIPFVLDTHAHADHMTALPYFASRYGSKTATGAKIGEIQSFFARALGLGDGFPVDGSQFHLLLEDREELDLGPFTLVAHHTPGHTTACMSFQIEDALFCGDTLFQPDYGTARCDFPNGSAATLHDSIQWIFSLPGETRLFTCHDYQPGGRELQFESTVAEQKRSNVQLDEGTSREAFIAFRKQRDAELEMPVLILPSIQVNIRAGQLPEPEANGTSYLKIPLNVFGAEP
jgi:glyoxylase-like metal-dependent hydrolase (beta-lactamase superfamily II)